MDAVSTVHERGATAAFPTQRDVPGPARLPQRVGQRLGRLNRQLQRLGLHRDLLVTVVCAGAATVAVLCRLYSPSALWLDEALSVGIAQRPVPELLEALRSDGSPPLYYLLLHGWIRAFGGSDAAVRALSVLFSLAALPLVHRAGQRLGGRLTAWSAVLLLSVSPFAVRYATEARMYALVQLLVAAGLLAVLRALESPTLARLVPVGALAGMLALTHYWSLFLLTCAAGMLLALAWQGSDRHAARRAFLALVAGGVLFLPWLPTFLFQVRRTGTPWAPKPGFTDAYYTINWWSGGTSGQGIVLSLLLIALGVLALVGRVGQGGIVLRRPVDRTAAALLALAGGTLVLGLGTGMILSAGYSARYSSVALVPGLLLAALGLRALPPRPRAAVLVLVSLTGLAGSLPQPFSQRRTQAPITVQTLTSRMQPGDLVVYCPDQLGPAVSRLLPPGTDQVVYPTGAAPQLVDWVDYADRNAAASPQAFARQLVARRPGAVWLVMSGGYKTFGRQCEQLADTLDDLRGEGRVVQPARRSYGEQQALIRYPEAPERR